MPLPLHLVGRFPPPRDGQTMATLRLADLLDEAYDVHRFNTGPGDSDHVQAAIGKFRLDAVRHYMRLRPRLRTALERAPHAPVLWPSFSPGPLGHLRDVLTIAPAFGPRQPVFAVVHRNTLADLFESPLAAPTAARLVRRLSGLVFLSDLLAERCEAWVPPEKRFVIPNFVDRSLTPSLGEIRAKREGRARRTTLRLLFLSDMMPEKGYLDVLEAVHLLNQRGVPVDAQFAGRWRSDDDEAAFRNRVRAHDLGGIVTHHGGVDQRRVRELNLWADVFLLPTYHPTEAQPISLLEALAAGSPAVVTRRPIMEAIVRDGEEAHLVAPRSPQAIADAVERLVPFEHWSGLSERARTRFETTYSEEAVRPLWRHLIASAG